jgi:hypothetical protein
VDLELGGKVECTVQPFDANCPPDLLGQLISSFVGSVDPSEVLLDLKPGTKRMTYCIIASAVAGNKLLNMDPEFLKDRRVSPGTEIPELLPPILGHSNSTFA